jgi:hypothetical protein
LDYIKLQNHQYHVNWKIYKTDVGQEFELRFVVANLEIGSLNFTPDKNKTIPIKIVINNHPRIRCRVLHEQGYSAPEIAAALENEFNLTPEDSARILADDGFSAYEVGLALKVVYQLDSSGVAQILMDTFGLDAQTTAQILLDLDFSVVEIGQALKDVFAKTDLETAIILKLLGFSAADVGLALRDVYALDASGVSQILFNAGFSLGEISPVLELIFNITKQQAHLVLSPIIIEVFGPTIYFYNAEVFYISSVEWFLDGTTLMQNNLGSSTPVLPSEIQTQAAVFGCSDAGISCWLKGAAAKKPGELNGAKAYVHVFHPPNQPGVFDLQFWLFYPYNGPGTLYTRIGELWDQASVLDPVGSHSGDWESVTMRFSDYIEPIQVFLSQHGDYPSFNYSEFAISDGNHIKTYSSYNGHANYIASGNNPERKVHFDIGVGHLDVDTFNRCSDTGLNFATHSNYEIVALDDSVFSGYEWIKFQGNWGPDVEMSMDSGTVPALLWEHFWPGVLAACGIVSIPCGPFYPVCFAACTGGATLGVEIARDDIIDVFYPGGLVASGPTSPGIKNSWSYDIFPEE